MQYCTSYFTNKLRCKDRLFLFLGLSFLRSFPAHQKWHLQHFITRHLISPPNFCVQRKVHSRHSGASFHISLLKRLHKKRGLKASVSQIFVSSYLLCNLLQVLAALDEAHFCSNGVCLQAADTSCHVAHLLYSFQHEQSQHGGVKLYQCVIVGF